MPKRERKSNGPHMTWESWKREVKPLKLSRDVLQYMADCHGHELHDIAGWNRIARECTMSVAFP